MRAKTTWTDEVIAIAKQLRLEGMSYEGISAELAKRGFSHSYSHIQKKAVADKWQQPENIHWTPALDAIVSGSGDHSWKASKLSHALGFEVGAHTVRQRKGFLNRRAEMVAAKTRQRGDPNKCRPKCLHTSPEFQRALRQLASGQAPDYVDWRLTDRYIADPVGTQRWARLTVANWQQLLKKTV